MGNWEDFCWLIVLMIWKMIYYTCVCLSGYARQAVCVHVCVYIYIVGTWSVWMSTFLCFLPWCVAVGLCLTSCLRVWLCICGRGLNCLNVCFFVFAHDVYVYNHVPIDICVCLVGPERTVCMCMCLFDCSRAMADLFDSLRRTSICILYVGR